jgi:2-isopropylmalate synthase
MLDDILNRVPMRQAPYVGASAFAHKAGLHASAILKDPRPTSTSRPTRSATPHHPDVEPGRAVEPAPRLAEAGWRWRTRAIPRWPRSSKRSRRARIEGYSYDTAQASFELLARARWASCPASSRSSATASRWSGEEQVQPMVSLSEAVVVVKIGRDKKLSVSESMDEQGSDRGPVNALAKALAKDLGPLSGYIDDMRLVDFKVRITQGGTEAVTRVVIDSEDSQGRRWSTVGVSPTSSTPFEALLDAITWKAPRGAPA